MLTVALSSVAEAVSGQSKNISELHTIFKKNSPGGYAKKRCSRYCANIMDLYWAAHLSQNNGYGLSSTYYSAIDRTSAKLLSVVKKNIDNGYPVIVPSNYIYTNAGHFWVIVGYKDTGDPDQSLIFMRNSATSNAGSKWETVAKLGKFVYHTNFDDSIYYLIVK